MLLSIGHPATQSMLLAQFDSFNPLSSFYSSALWNGLQSSINCHFLTSVVTLFLPTAAFYYPHIHLLLCQTTSFKLQYLLSRRETGRLLLGLKAKSINAQMLLLNVTWNVNNCAFYTKTSSTFCTKHTHMITIMQSSIIEHAKTLFSWSMQFRDHLQCRHLHRTCPYLVC